MCTRKLAILFFLIFVSNTFSQKVLEKTYLPAVVETCKIYSNYNITIEGKLKSRDSLSMLLVYPKCYILKVSDGTEIYEIYLSYKEGKKIKRNKIYYFFGENFKTVTNYRHFTIEHHTP